MQVLHIGQNPISETDIHMLMKSLPGDFEVDLIVRLEEKEIRGGWEPFDPASGGGYWEAKYPTGHFSHGERTVVRSFGLIWECEEEEAKHAFLPAGLWVFRIRPRFKWNTIDVQATLLEAEIKKNDAEEELRGKIRGKMLLLAMLVNGAAEGRSTDGPGSLSEQVKNELNELVDLTSRFGVPTPVRNEEGFPRVEFHEWLGTF